MQEDELKTSLSQAWVAHGYNPSNLGGREQEDCSSCSSKPARVNSSRDPIPKKLITHKKVGWEAGGVAQGVGPEIKLWYHPKKKK
jgi:hypothetical protein